MRIIHAGAIIILLFLSFSLGRFYNTTEKNTGEDTPKRQLISQTTPSPISDQRIHLWKESFEVSPNGRYKAESYMGNYADYYNYHQIFITDLTNNRMWRIYNGDFRTLGWEWTGNNKIKIFYNCGTGCKASKVIGLNESLSIADYKDGRMNEKNGWKVEFFKTF